GTFPYYIYDMPWIQGIIIVEELLASEPYILKNDESGGDCNKIGNWKASSKTCTFNTDISTTIVVRSNNLILDGNGHMIDGNYDERIDSPRACIFVDAKLGVTIKNFEIQNCAIGISFQDTMQSYVIDNIISNNIASGISMLASNDNIIKNNVVKNNPNGGIAFNGNGNLIEGNSVLDNSNLYLGQTLQGVGISLNLEGSTGNIFRSNEVNGHYTGLNFGGVHSSNTVEDNIIENNNRGIALNTSEDFLIQNNIIKNNEFGIHSYMYSGSGGKNTFRQNDISNNVKGIHLDSGKNIITENSIISNSEYGLLLFDGRSTHGNKIFNNNFIDNSRQVVQGAKNFFTVDGSGNYWDDFSLDCKDVDSDKICDDPYPFGSGTVGVVDTAVWTIQNGWIGQKSTPVVIEPTPEPESTVEPEKMSESKLPDWVRNIFIWYAEDRISEDGLLGAIQFLVQQGIIRV
ncbi:MAG: right-handed parallel beta-helix repeat-containing protein, partial [Thaumarchaeota archaeon]|nr:right-handed parallel beta-helix repeat-containing protein [Nitrososphaerota archaeon]